MPHDPKQIWEVSGKDAGILKMVQERRHKKRHPIQIDATIITPTAFIPAVTVNINTEGIRILSPDPILPETDIALSLAIGEETLLSGAILWVLEVNDKQGMTLYDVGIEIESIILKEQEAIGFAEKEAILTQILTRIQQTSESPTA